MRRSKIVRAAKWSTPLLLLFPLVALSGSGQANAPKVDRSKVYNHLSSGVVARQYLLHPERAPEGVRQQYQGAHDALAQARRTAGSASAAQTVDGLLRFNRDQFGLPQNEESVSTCYDRPDVVLGGTNDYRGLLNPLGNFTGWHYSNNGGKSLTNEGLLPAVQIFGKQVPSGGDPVDVATGDCKYLYAASLNYDAFDPFGKPNGLGLYRTTPERLASCPGGDAPSCWPVRKAVSQTKSKNHFIDKEWMTVGGTGNGGQRVVWATYSEFDLTPTPTAEFTGAVIKAVRCDVDLNNCTKPILISGKDKDVQFSDVTVDADGRTYITWSEIQGELEATAQTFIHKLRVAEPGSTNFGPTRIVYRETSPIPFGGELHSAGFRAATYPKNTVKIIDGHSRVFVTWEACRFLVTFDRCEEPQIKLRYSDNLGRSWSPIQIVSVGGDNYFPTISKDRNENQVVMAYYTNRFDRVFHNRQDVEYLRIDSRTTHVTSRQRVTPFSNEIEADPIFNDGRFIGDYFEISAARERAYVHFNANYVSVRFLGQGVPVPQQDNFLARVPA